MKKIKNSKEFLEWCQPFPDSLSYKLFLRTNYKVGNDELKLERLTFENLDLSSRSFESTEFLDCYFDNCKFNNTFFCNCTFNYSIFTNCEFYSSKFLEDDFKNINFINCQILGLEICDTEIVNSKFIDCTEIYDLKIRGNRNRQILFRSCFLYYLDIEPISIDNSETINFTDCIIEKSSFDRIDFSKSKFNNSTLSLNQFTSCVFSNETFIEKNDTPSKEYNFIDFRTILDSEIQLPSILEDLFGIPNPYIKEYLHGLTFKIEFQSIFISYSFADKEFANKINDELIKKGIMTFLWEKDSPGGIKLKNIMSTEIKEKDRILFIASKNSLKSPACQFELSEGRIKQESTWEDVLFPIHLDKYLFEIIKDNIRPLEKQEEYWENIIELRNLNSLDFIEFSGINNIDKIKFDTLIFRLIKGLRKNK